MRLGPIKKSASASRFVSCCLVCLPQSLPSPRMAARSISHDCHRLRYSSPACATSCQVIRESGRVGALSGFVRLLGTGTKRSTGTSTVLTSMIGVAVQPVKINRNGISSAIVAIQCILKPLNIISQFPFQPLTLGVCQ